MTIFENIPGSFTRVKLSKEGINHFGGGFGKRNVTTGEFIRFCKNGNIAVLTDKYKMILPFHPSFWEEDRASNQGGK